MTISLIAVPETQAYALKTTYTVVIHADGTASWTIEQSAYLETESDQASFFQLINRAMTYIDQFTSNVSAIIDHAYDITGRFMMAENISIGGNVSGVGAYGFLDYRFDWTNFAIVANTSIALGDAFSNDTFMLGDGGLSIILPTGYRVKSCSPTPDHESNSMLEWDTISDFEDGQPAIAATEGNSLFPFFPVLLGITTITICAVLASLLILRVKNRKKESTPQTSPDEITWKQDDTQRILAQLKKEGGQVLQSKITEQLKFSKAKTSKILGEMESKGIIKRHKRGRDKVVSLQEEKEKTKE